MCLLVTSGGTITPFHGMHKAQEAEQAVRVLGWKEIVLGELEPDPRPCPLLTLLGQDTGTSQHIGCKTHKRQGDTMKHPSDSTVTSSCYSVKKASAPRVKRRLFQSGFRFITIFVPSSFSYLSSQIYRS